MLVVNPEWQGFEAGEKMSDDGYDIGASGSTDDDVGGWGSDPPKKDDLAMVLEKEKIIKYVRNHGGSDDNIMNVS